jgi:hypothetical protein
VANLKEDIYEHFFDPTDEFLREPRAFIYDLAEGLLIEAKKASPGDWYEDERVVKGILLLLYTWNFAARETKKLSIENLGPLVTASKKNLQFLEGYDIISADEGAWPRVETTFDIFRPICGQTGASKALSLLNPRLFVMWDTGIRSWLGTHLIRGIGNGETGEKYALFLRGSQRIIGEYHLKEKLPPDSNVAKKFDEYNYVQMVMRRRSSS